jgi:uncharacterized membrane protein
MLVEMLEMRKLLSWLLIIGSIALMLYLSWKNGAISHKEKLLIIIWGAIFCIVPGILWLAGRKTNGRY